MSETATSPAQEPDAAWACVEIFGHRRLWGRITEVEQFGARMLRIDEPADAESEEFRTSYYGGAAIFSVTPCTEALARKNNTVWKPRPVQLLEDRAPDDADDWGAPDV
jgi:hypothetical protein